MLLEVPNPKDPQDAEVASMLKDDPPLFARTAHHWAVKYAGATPQTTEYKEYQASVKTVATPEEDLKRCVYTKREAYKGSRRSSATAHWGFGKQAENSLT
jgi:hypothetical protein